MDDVGGEGLNIRQYYVAHRTPLGEGGDGACVDDQPQRAGIGRHWRCVSVFWGLKGEERGGYILDSG